MPAEQLLKLRSTLAQLYLQNWQTMTFLWLMTVVQLVNP